MTGAVASFHPWSPAEDSTLRVAYLTGGIAAAKAELPGRSPQALYHRAQRLMVLRRRRWTPDDDARLRSLWDGELALPAIAARLGRTEITTYWRAQKIRLPLGCPAGYEYLSKAARRTGYDTGQLHRVLSAADATVKRALVAPCRKRKGKSTSPLRLHWIVFSAEVDVAVEAWHETEPVQAAAARVGVCGETLTRRLRALGFKKPVHSSGPGRPKAKRHWRVRPEEVEAAMRAPFGRWAKRKQAARGAVA